MFSRVFFLNAPCDLSKILYESVAPLLTTDAFPKARESSCLSPTPAEEKLWLHMCQEKGLENVSGVTSKTELTMVLTRPHSSTAVHVKYTRILNALHLCCYDFFIRDMAAKCCNIWDVPGLIDLLILLESPLFLLSMAEVTC